MINKIDEGDKSEKYVKILSNITFVNIILDEIDEARTNIRVL